MCKNTYHIYVFSLCSLPALLCRLFAGSLWLSLLCSFVMSCSVSVMQSESHAGGSCSI